MKIKTRLVILLIFIFILTGCQASTQTTSADTVIYNSTKGDVEIPKNPTRIVTDNYIGQLLSVGANVVGGDLTYTSPAWDVSSITDVGQSAEAVASLNPDLIVIQDPTKYEQYKTIAPTVLIPYGDYNEEELVTQMGIITNKEDNAKKTLDDFNAKVDELKGLIDDSSLTYSLLEFYGEDPYIYGDKYGRLGYVIYDKLGLKCTDTCQNTIIGKPDSYLLLTQENVKDYTGDVVIISTPDGKPVDNAIVNSESFKESSAYKNNRVYYEDARLWWQVDMVSMMQQMDLFEEILKDETI